MECPLFCWDRNQGAICIDGSLPPTENEPIGDPCDKLISRIPSSGQIDRQSNGAPVFPVPPLFPSSSGQIDSQTNRVPVSPRSRW